MNSKEKGNKKMLQALLKMVRNAAVRGAGRASYKGTFEAKVPDSLKNRKMKSRRCRKQRHSLIECGGTNHETRDEIVTIHFLLLMAAMYVIITTM